MSRHSILCCSSTIACLLVVATSARAEVTSTESDGDNLTIIRMTVTPAAEPVPAFKYRFQPRDIDLKPGNAAPFYYRALMIASNTTKTLTDKYGDVFYEWCQPATATDSTSLGNLPLEKVREAVELSTGGPIGQQLDFATTRRRCDWEIGLDETRGPDLISIPLGEFQESRQLSRMLNLRARLAIAERRYADAIDSMRTNYRLATDFASAPFIVSGLIGIAEASLTNGTVTELIAAPGSPNLYWALAELPQPLVNLRPAARFEMEFGLRMFPFIHDAETTDRSPDEWNRLFTLAVRNLSSLGDSNTIFPVANDVGAGLGATALALAGYPLAKERLIEQGTGRERVEQMSVGQVMAIYTGRLYQRLADEYEKQWYMPYAEMRSRDQAIDNAVRDARMLGPNPNREVLPIVTLLLPAMQQARTAEVRLERDLAALRVIEALRLHAAAHDGKLPGDLNDVTEVPVPLNPVTGKPFVYRLDGTTAILELPKSDGIYGYNRRYEIQIADTKK
jgi:hypothetical protein